MEEHRMLTDQTKRGFISSSGQDPHQLRKRQILRAHPEISSLFGYDWRTKYIALAVIILQLYMAWLTLSWSWLSFLVAIYVIGVTANHALIIAVHEFTHNLGAQRPEHNRLIGLLISVPIGFPIFFTFKKYHMDHHRYLGTDEDTDIPTLFEAYAITGSSWCYADHAFRKALFVIFYMFFYSIRPMVAKPDKITFDRWIVANWVLVLAFNMAVKAFLGPSANLYIFLSSLFTGTLHPVAGHFIGDHYVMEDEPAETYSHYGPLNLLTFNAGYHNEHHDFPNVPWSRLPKVRELAPEYYDALPECKSWIGTQLRYIFDDSVSPFSRIHRGAKKKLADTPPANSSTMNMQL